MIYLVAILFPPLALLIYGKIFQAIFNLVIWLFAVITIPLPFCRWSRSACRC